MPLAGDWPQEGMRPSRDGGREPRGASICAVIGCPNVAQPANPSDVANSANPPFCFSHQTPLHVGRAPTAAEERSATIGELLAMARDLAE